MPGPAGNGIASGRANRDGPALADATFVVPGLHDVHGAPVPGVSGVRPKPVPQGRTVPTFQDLLRQLRVRPTTSGVAASGGAVGTTSRPATTTPRVVPARPAPVKAGQRATTSTARPRAGVVRPLRGAAREALVRTIHRVSASADVSPTLSVAIARAESSLDPTAVSSDGKSVGTFQMTAATKGEMQRKIARGVVDRPSGPDDVALPVGYLGYLDDVFSRATSLGGGRETIGVQDGAQRQLFAVAAYNAGEGRVAAAQGRAAAAGLDPTRFAQVRPFLPSTTQAYVDRVVRYEREEAATLTATADATPQAV